MAERSWRPVVYARLADDDGTAPEPVSAAGDDEPYECRGGRFWAYPGNAALYPLISGVSGPPFQYYYFFIGKVTGTSAPEIVSMGDWKDQTGLSKSTKVAKIYVQEDIKEEWKREAEERGLSLSKHLRYTVQKARYLREKGRFKFLLKLLIPTELKSRMYERRIRGTSFESSNPS